jgi:hypothetical protein
MNTFDITLDNVNITITGDSAEEIVDTLRNNELESLIYNNFYFSRTTQQRTGEGWIQLKEMHDNFIVNSFVARLSESIRAMYKNVSVSDNPLEDMYFEAFLQSLVDSLNFASVIVDPNNNQPILQGLVNELTRRSLLNSGFDEEQDNVLSSESECCSDDNVCDGNCGTSVRADLASLAWLDRA